MSKHNFCVTGVGLGVCVTMLCCKQGCIAAGVSCLAKGTLRKRRHLTKPTTAIPHGLFGSVEFSSDVVFWPFVLNGSTGLQLRPVETLDLLSLRSAYFPWTSQLWGGWFMSRMRLLSTLGAWILCFPEDWCCGKNGWILCGLLDLSMFIRCTIKANYHGVHALLMPRAKVWNQASVSL